MEMEEEIWEDPPCCGFCNEATAAMAMDHDAVCYAHYWHPFACTMLPMCDPCITFFDTTSIDAEGATVVITIPCDGCGGTVEQAIMYWVMFRGGWWLCETCVATWMEPSWEPVEPLAQAPVSAPFDETWVRRAYTYHNTRIRTFQQRDARTIAFVLADLCRVLGIPSVDEACTWLHEDMLEMVWAGDEPEPLLIVTEQGLYHLLMACYRQGRHDEVMLFIHWLWWEMPIGRGKP